MHDCKYAATIHHPGYWITNESGVEMCGFCHVPKKEEPKVAPPKTVRK